MATNTSDTENGDMYNQPKVNPYSKITLFVDEAISKTGEFN